MLDDPNALRISFFSIVIKAAAAVRSFPDGVEGLDRRFCISRRNSALLIVVCMSAQDAEHMLRELDRAGVRPGEDLAVGDMHQGVLLPCPGIVFEEIGGGPLPIWNVTFIPVGE